MLIKNCNEDDLYLLSQINCVYVIWTKSMLQTLANICDTAEFIIMHNIVIRPNAMSEGVL